MMNAVLVESQQKKIWHSMTVEELRSELDAPATGLDAEEASLRLSRFGPNVLITGSRKTLFSLILGQFTDFMILVLLAAAVISALTGDVKDALAILIIVVLNAMIGFFQEYRAERAMEALAAMAAPLATVLRRGEIKLIDAAELVPGDSVLLEAGKIVPADLRLTEAIRLQMDESSLTGESVPAEKNVQPLKSKSSALGDRLNMAYKGTVVTFGRGSGLVVETGMKTEFGKIAALLEGASGMKTPLQKRLAGFGKKISIAALLICAVVFIFGILRGEDAFLMFMTAVSLAVAAIPEALPAVVTISLAIGAGKMVQKKALVRKLPAVEALGSVTFICTDKTGTLTQNRMRVELFYCDGNTLADPGQGRVWETLLRGMALCNDAVEIMKQGVVTGDPTETALFEAARRGGIQKHEIEKIFPRVAEIPFDSVRKRMTTFHCDPEGGYISFTKGSPESVLANSTGIFQSSGGASFQAAPLATLSEKMAVEGLRVLAFAMRRWENLPSTLNPEELEKEMTFIGFSGLMDPPREEARESVALCKKAGITPVMITGDHPGTATAIARRLGILDHEENAMITGEELDRISMEDFEKRVREIRVYARVSPEQKLKIVTALQDLGEFVAMTGDGVNDAPALKRADIGVAMGNMGTDVAKEASSMILLDDNFATIVRAVKEGRKIYDNIRRFIRYSVTTNSAEVWIIFLAPFFGLPIPLLPIQILWINLLTDGLPGLALAAEPAEKDIMSRPPRPPGEGVFAHGLGIHVLWVGTFMAAVTLVTEAVLVRTNGVHGQTIIFTVLCFSQLAHVLAIRSEKESLFTLGLLSNKPLLAAVLATFLLHMAALYIPALNTVFRTQPLSLLELGIAIALSFLVFLAVEFEKFLIRRRARHSNSSIRAA